MRKDGYYHCIRCGHVGSEVVFDEGLKAASVCVICGSYETEPCAAPEGRTVPLKTLMSAEGQALHWKKQAEALSAIINRAASAGAMAANYVTEARIIQAGL